MFCPGLPLQTREVPQLCGAARPRPPSDTPPGTRVPLKPLNCRAAPELLCEVACHGLASSPVPPPWSRLCSQPPPLRPLSPPPSCGQGAQGRRCGLPNFSPPFSATDLAQLASRGLESKAYEILGTNLTTAGFLPNLSPAGVSGFSPWLGLKTTVILASSISHTSTHRNT